MVSLETRLRTVIDQLAVTARTSKLISINAALIAGRNRGRHASDSVAFETVAAEIQRLSEESSAGIDELHTVLDTVQILSRTINLAGRQRMLSQKIMKVFLILRERRSSPLRVEQAALIAEFENAQAKLAGSGLNTAQIRETMSNTKSVWARFREALNQSDLEMAITTNEQLLLSLHQTVLLYEDIAGARRRIAA